MGGGLGAISDGNSLSNRLLVALALIGSLGSGALSYKGTADRYTAEDARRDFELRDERISRIGENHDRLEIKVSDHHSHHLSENISDDVKALQSDIHRIDIFHAKGGI